MFRQLQPSVTLNTGHRLYCVVEMPEEEGVDLLCAVQKFRLVPFGVLLVPDKGQLQ